MDLSLGMDIVGYTNTNAIQNLQSGVSIAVLKETLDLQEVLGDQITQMMELSVNPAVGGTIDIRI